MRSKMKGREAKREALLEAAAEFIMRDGPNAVNLNELAKQVGTVRANVYAIFGSANPRIAIFEGIVGRFLQEAKSAIASVIINSAPNSSAVEKLTGILRVTLHLFKENPRSGKVVLAHLNMKRSAFQPVHEIFRYVDFVIGRAIEKGEIVVGFPSDQIRLILFSVMYGLLRALYLDEKGPSGTQGELTFSETAIHRGVLQVLSGLCSAPARTQIDSQIAAL